MRSWLRASCLALVLASVALLLGVGIYYLPLQVDGGWYSYPAFAYSLGRDPFSNQADFGATCLLPGLKSLFPFETTSSVRLFYASAWFHVFGNGFLALKLLSLLELGTLCVLAWILYRRFFERRDLALLAMGFVLTDKGLLMPGVSDFRPDLPLAAASVGLFLVMNATRASPVRVAMACLLASFTALIGPTSAVPLAFIVVWAAASAYFAEPAERKPRALLAATVTVVALLAFLARAPLFRAGLHTAIQVREPVDALQRMSAVLHGGPQAVIGKELRRLGEYFFVSNAAQLAMLLVCVGALLVKGGEGRRVPAKLRAPLLGLAAAMLALALLDPHSTSAHLIPLTPFTLLLLAKFEGVQRSPVRLVALLLAASATLGLAVGANAWRANVRRGTSNRWLQSTLAELTAGRQPYVVLGPTELWPYFPRERDITLIDQTRDARQFSREGVAISDVDYVIVNRDYDVGAWRSLLQRLTPGAVALVEKPTFLTVWRVPRLGAPCNVQRPPASGAERD